MNEVAPEAARAPNKFDGYYHYAVFAYFKIADAPKGSGAQQEGNGVPWSGNCLVVPEGDLAKYVVNVRYFVDQAALTEWEDRFADEVNAFRKGAVLLFTAKIAKVHENELLLNRRLNVR